MDCPTCIECGKEILPTDKGCLTKDGMLHVHEDETSCYYRYALRIQTEHPEKLYEFLMSRAARFPRVQESVVEEMALVRRAG